MLEHKFGVKAKPDIKSLSLEGMEKREEIWFDVERDVTPIDQEKIKDVLSSYRDQGREKWFDFAVLASHMICLGLKPEVTPRDKQTIKEQIKELVRLVVPNWSFAHTASIVRPLGLELEITPIAKEIFILRLLDDRTKRQWLAFADLAAQMCLIGLEPEVTQEDKKKMQEELVKDRQRGYWWSIAAYASKMRLLGIEPELTPKDREEMKEELIKLRNTDNWPGFSYLALNMRILSADEIKVGGPKGLEIIDHAGKPGLVKETPSLPDQRNF